MILTPRDVEIRHFHLFCGIGGGARGFNRGHARVGHAEATFRCLGGVDIDKAAIADFTKLAGVRGTVLDLFSRDQYLAFHGVEPPADYREATPVDLQRAAGFERPHIGFGSAPCKGFSGLLSAVPPDAAAAIASVMGQTLLLAWAGETFQLSAAPIWVQPIVIALSVQTEAIA